MSVPFVRSPYNYDRDLASAESALDCSGSPSLAKQSFADECDINTIVRNFGLTGQLPDNVTAPQYGDFEGIFDYQSALNAVIAAEDSFMAMPADLRARFHNSPQALLEFVSNDSNRDEAVKLGLVDPPPVSSPPVSTPPESV
ncbi:MAG: internal scaffolding protein [Microviridae sp.]|nr:MAG: internal scaffolding protein [Microviridae sp.]